MTPNPASPKLLTWYFNTTSNYIGATQLVDNGTLYANSRTARLTITNLTANDNGYYLVIVTNQFGSVTSIVASLTVNTSPTIVSQFPLTYTNLFALYPGANPNFTNWSGPEWATLPNTIDKKVATLRRRQRCKCRTVPWPA